MASSFSANQYERAFNPRRLCNWEVPRRYPERPRARSGCSKAMADENGRLLPGVPRSAPWPQLPVTAWDYPKKITRAYAQQMQAEANRRYMTWLKRSSHQPLPQQEAPPTPVGLPASRKARSATRSRRQERPTRQSSAASARSAPLPGPPESLSEIKPVSTPPGPLSDVKATGTPPGPLTPPGSAPPASLVSSRSRRSSTASSRPHTAPAPTLPLEPPPSLCTTTSQPRPPLGLGYSDFQVARSLAAESRSHQPLPDTVHDPLFCAAQARRDPGPAGLALPPPTPPAAGDASPPPEQHKTRRRPSTSCHPLRRITEMDLAIRWDLRLNDEKQEQRRRSSGNRVAPAVFNVVPPVDCGLPDGCGTPPPPLPKTAWVEEIRRPPTPRIRDKENSNPNIPNPPPTPSPPPKPRPKSPPVRRSRSTPNLQQKRDCVACNTAENFVSKPSNEYKQAFKAGKPNNTRPHTAKPVLVAVPKPRKPFSKRSYSIATLAPPFSLWPDGSRSQDYPDHWRLASVYQHAFKPPQLRRKPLLASVYQ